MTHIQYTACHVFHNECGYQPTAFLFAVIQWFRLVSQGFSSCKGLGALWLGMAALTHNPACGGQHTYKHPSE